MDEKSSYLNTKTPKKFIESRTTLDNLHKLQINELQQETNGIDDIAKRIQLLETSLESINDVIVKNKKEDQIVVLRRKLKELNENKPTYDYFFETGEILYKYYEIQEKIHQGGRFSGGTQMKAKPGSVLAALAGGDSEFSNNEKSSSKSKDKEEGREVLLEKYLMKIDPEHAITPVTTFEDPYGMCDKCDKEMTFSTNEALFYCDVCGYQEFVLIDSDKPSYKDPPREVTYYAYKRINHFNEWLAQFQAKESTEIPEDVFQAILEELKKERITSVESIKPTKIREILKKLKCTNFYEHVPYILNRINGKTAPVMSREIEEKLRFMFKEIQASFIKHCPKNRSNFLSYSYVLYKFCELLELDDYLKCFPLLKNRDKLYNQDKIWKLICSDLKWECIKSV